MLVHLRRSQRRREGGSGRAGTRPARCARPRRPVSRAPVPRRCLERTSAAARRPAGGRANAWLRGGAAQRGARRTCFLVRSVHRGSQGHAGTMSLVSINGACVASAPRRARAGPAATALAAAAEQFCCAALASRRARRAARAEGQPGGGGARRSAAGATHATSAAAGARSARGGCARGATTARLAPCAWAVARAPRRHTPPVRRAPSAGR